MTKQELRQKRNEAFAERMAQEEMFAFVRCATFAPSIAATMGAQWGYIKCELRTRFEDPMIGREVRRIMRGT